MWKRNIQEYRTLWSAKQEQLREILALLEDLKLAKADGQLREIQQWSYLGWIRENEEIYGNLMGRFAKFFILLQRLGALFVGYLVQLITWRIY